MGIPCNMYFRVPTNSDFDLTFLNHNNQKFEYSFWVLVCMRHHNEIVTSCNIHNIYAPYIQQQLDHLRKIKNLYVL